MKGWRATLASLAERLPRRAGPGLVCVGLVMALVFAPMFGAAERRADGYSALIDDVFAKRKWLTIYPPELQKRPRPIVAVSGVVLDRIPHFYHRSALWQDIHADDPSLWRIEGARVVGIEPSAHFIPGPFDLARMWQGEILFREGAEVQTVLETPDGGRLTLSPAVRVAEPAHLRVDLAQSGLVDGTQIVSFIKNGAEVATVRLIGLTPVLRFRAGAGADVCINGANILDLYDIRSGGATFDALNRRLQMGDTLALGVDCQEVVWTVRPVSHAMSYRTPTGARRYAPSGATLARALDQAMIGVRPATEDLNLTLSQALHERVGDLLAEQGQTIDAQQAFRAAATVMDASTGEILALASFPTRLDQLPSADRRKLSASTLIGRNHNFTRLPIGSVAKVPFSAAILEARPALHNLNIPGASDVRPGPKGPELAFETVLGVRIARAGDGWRETHELDRVDFDAFMELSSNRYASSLMLLGRTETPFVDDPGLPLPPAQRYQLAGEDGGALFERAFLPALSPRPEPGDQGYVMPDPGVDLSWRWPWVATMDRLFDLPMIGSDGAKDVAAQYDERVWSNLRSRHRKSGLSSLTAISPETERFAVGADRAIQDYLQLILGGARSRWTTIKVAEVFSRLVTGLEVRAALEPRLEAPTNLPIKPGVRQNLLHAMEQVVQGEHGTARALKKPVSALAGIAGARGETLRIFAKTGTPTVGLERQSKANRAVNALLDHGLAQIRRGRLKVGAASQARQMARALGSNRRAMEELAAHGVTANVVGDYMDDLNTRRTNLIGEDSVLPDQKDDHEAGVLAFTVARYRPEAPIRPHRALTVVINIQDRNSGGPNPAIELAGRMLKDGAFRRALFEDPEEVSDAQKP
jgi:hypothetical protein